MTNEEWFAGRKARTEWLRGKAVEALRRRGIEVTPKQLEEACLLVRDVQYEPKHKR